MLSIFKLLGFLHIRQIALLLCLFFSSLPVTAQKLIEAGETSKPDADEAYLLLAIDSAWPVHRVQLVRENRLFDSGVKHRHPGGRSYALYVAKVGRYEWKEVERLPNWVFNLGDDPEFSFTIRPGVINYPGDLVIEPDGPTRANFAVYNRSLQAMDWLESNHPKVFAVPFAYSGHYPDPYPELLQRVRAANVEAGQKVLPGSGRLLPPAEPKALPLEPETLWQRDYVLGVDLSPDGRFAAVHLRDQPQNWTVELIDLVKGDRVALASFALPFATVQWAGSSRLVLETSSTDFRTIELLQIELDAQDRGKFSAVKLPRFGDLVDALPNEPDHILFASRSRRGQMMVHKVDMSSQSSANAFKPIWDKRLNKGLKNDRAWFVDSSAGVRVAIIERDQQRIVVHGSAGEFRDVAFPEDDDFSFEPHTLSSDGKLIFGLSDHQRGQRDLVAFDIATGRISDTLFARSGLDVVAPIMDAQRVPIGVNYYQGGRLVSEYFEEKDQRLAKMLERAFPGKNTRVASRSADGSQQLVWIDAGNRPPQLFHIDVPARTASPVIDSMPWLADLQFSETQVVAVPLADGTVLDAFLTLPEGSAQKPLIAFPHGGPIGVADKLHFDPEVQFLASLGYAVLQVNFRGSDGYGRAFREAGHRNLGTLIEDDIDAAIKFVLNEFPIDGDRMCVLGSSYGGYSALIATVRWPQRFRCAVSIAGVSDPIFHFTATDSAQSPELRTQLEEIIGDPNQQLTHMMGSSPVYQFEKIQTPLLLAHGLNDRRVDPEHTYRLSRLLHLAGRTPQGMLFENDGHGLNQLDNIHALWRGVAAFLRTHLGDPLAAAAPKASKDSAEPSPAL